MTNNNSNNAADDDDNKYGDRAPDDGLDVFGVYDPKKCPDDPARPEWKKDWISHWNMNSEMQLDYFVNTYWSEFVGDEKKKKEILTIYQEYAKVEAAAVVDYAKMNEILNTCANLGVDTVSEVIRNYPDVRNEEKINLRIQRFGHLSMPWPPMSQGGSANAIDDVKRVSLLECLMFIFSKGRYSFVNEVRPAVVDRVEKARKGMWAFQHIMKMKEILLEAVDQLPSEFQKKQLLGSDVTRLDGKLHFVILYLEEAREKFRIQQKLAKQAPMGIWDAAIRRDKYEKFLKESGFDDKTFEVAKEMKAAAEEALQKEIKQGSDATRWIKSQSQS